MSTNTEKMWAITSTVKEGDPWINAIIASASDDIRDEIDREILRGMKPLSAYEQLRLFSD